MGSCHRPRAPPGTCSSSQKTLSPAAIGHVPRGTEREREREKETGMKAKPGRPRERTPHGAKRTQLPSLFPARPRARGVGAQSQTLTAVRSPGPGGPSPTRCPRVQAQVPPPPGGPRPRPVPGAQRLERWRRREQPAGIWDTGCRGGRGAHKLSPLQGGPRGAPCRTHTVHALPRRDAAATERGNSPEP